MNYLAHHYFFASADPWHNTGLVLPDLARSVPGRKKLNWTENTNATEFEAVWAGCLKHYEADAWFHQSRFFDEVKTAIESDLAGLQQEGLLPGQRKWFLAHLLTEMLLDRVIMDRASGAAEHFYADLHAVDPGGVLRFLMESGKQEPGSFIRLFEGFRNAGFIRSYSNNIGIARALGQVLLRTRQPAVSEPELNALSLLMDGWIKLAHTTEKPAQMGRLFKW